MAAKNHATILPDASKERTLDALAGAAFGASGQRCMALSCAVFVGEAKNWIPELAEKAKKLKVSSGATTGADLGPLISKDAKARVSKYVLCQLLRHCLSIYMIFTIHTVLLITLRRRVLRLFWMDVTSRSQISPTETSLDLPSSLTLSQTWSATRRRFVLFNPH